MLTLVLASLLAAPPAGEPWSISLHPAVVVRAEDPEPALDLAETAASPAQEAPRLAPALTLQPKERVRKAPRSRARGTRLVLPR